MSPATGSAQLDVDLDHLDLAVDLENWMHNLPMSLKALPIVHLAIPGSHDSGTWSINSKSSIAPDAEAIVERLANFLPCISRVIARWSRCQELSFYEQLQAGVRYFDIRIAIKVSDDGKTRAFHIVHSLYGALVQDALLDIKSFLETHPSEIVIFDCQHFYDFNHRDHCQLAALILHYFGNKIVPLSGDVIYMKHLTLQYMAANRYQVIIVYRHCCYKEFHFFPNKAYPTPWPNQTNPDKLIEILTANLLTRNENIGYVSQFILTPDAGVIIKNLIGGTLKKFSGIQLYKKKYDWVKGQVSGKNGVNVIIADFVDINDKDFCRTVININLKLLKQMRAVRRSSRELPPVTN